MNNPNVPNQGYPQAQQNPQTPPYGQEPQVQQPQQQAPPQPHPQAMQQPYPAQPGPQQPYPQQMHPGAPMPGQPAGPQAYQQGPAKVKKSGDNEFAALFKELGKWLKSFFSPDFTESVDLARKSKVKFTWAAPLVIFFLLLPVFTVISALAYDWIGFRSGAGDGFLLMLRSNLSTLVMFIAAAGVIYLNQLIFKDDDKWYGPLNAGAMVLVPRILYMPLAMFWNIIPVGFFRELNRILNFGITALMLILVFKVLWPNREKKKGGSWIICGLMTLFMIVMHYADRVSVMSWFYR